MKELVSGRQYELANAIGEPYPGQKIQFAELELQPNGTWLPIDQGTHASELLTVLLARMNYQYGLTPTEEMAKAITFCEMAEHALQGSPPALPRVGSIHKFRRVKGAVPT